MFLIILQCSPVNAGNVAVTTVLECGNTGSSLCMSLQGAETVHTYTNKALCKAIHLHFKSKTFGYFTAQQGTLKL